MPTKSQRQIRKELFSLILTIFAFISILSTVISVVNRFDELRKMCVCISNFLAYSWEAFGASIIFGILYFFFKQGKNSKLLLAIQSVLFLAGILLLILFGSYLSNVLG